MEVTGQGYALMGDASIEATIKAMCRTKKEPYLQLTQFFLRTKGKCTEGELASKNRRKTVVLVVAVIVGVVVMVIVGQQLQQ